MTPTAVWVISTQEAWKKKDRPSAYIDLSCVVKVSLLRCTYPSKRQPPWEVQSGESQGKYTAESIDARASITSRGPCFLKQDNCSVKRSGDIRHRPVWTQQQKEQQGRQEPTVLWTLPGLRQITCSLQVQRPSKKFLQYLIKIIFCIHIHYTYYILYKPVFILEVSLEISPAQNPSVSIWDQLKQWERPPTHSQKGKKKKSEQENCIILHSHLHIPSLPLKH